MKQEPKVGDRYIIGDRIPQSDWKYCDGNLHRCIHCDRVVPEDELCNCASLEEATSNLEDISANDFCDEMVFCECTYPDFELQGYTDKARTLRSPGMPSVLMFPIFRCSYCGLRPGNYPAPPLFLCDSCSFNFSSGCRGYALIAQFDIAIICFGYQCALDGMWTGGV